MQNGEPAGRPSGYVCPRCGGALWEPSDGHSAVYECRIGHTFEALELWIAHCAARNTALEHAARALAENAAVARKLAAWTRERDNLAAAARLEVEARIEEQFLEQVRQMLEGLQGAEPGPMAPGS